LLLEGLPKGRLAAEALHAVLHHLGEAELRYPGRVLDPLRDGFSEGLVAFQLDDHQLQPS
jgi:hypothetical protein